jgi:hypothetical protein
MSLGNTFENDLMKLIFQGTAIANIADNAASSPLTNLYLALHTADPGESGDQTISEISYTGYARPAVARSSGGWTVTNNAATLVGIANFGDCSGGAGGTVTHWSIGTASSGAGKILFSGTVLPNFIVASGVPVKLAITTNATLD